MELVFFKTEIDQDSSTAIDFTQKLLLEKGVNISPAIRTGSTPEEIQNFAEEIVGGKKLGVFFTCDGTFHSILLNKVKGVRAALAYSSYEGGMTRKVFVLILIQHNDANFLILDVSILGTEFLESIIEPYSKETFDCSETVQQHKKRVDKLHVNEK